ncbi:MAG: glycosyltransferase [Thermoplasmata archaeon]|nr:glycosyltransferase [Thermoplasmata archaeon]
MGSDPSDRSFISIVITVKNEGAHLRHLLESLVPQEGPYEVIVVDALSRDDTFDIAQEFAARYPNTFQARQRFGSRGMGRNAGVELARGEFIAFTDGDCFADSHWLSTLRSSLGQDDVVAGRTVPVGRSQYNMLERVELFQRGSDVTYPSCNLGYRRSLFQDLGGFDPHFITAEDIDLNLRAVERGARIRYEERAIIYHAMRPSFIRFLYQAFWNGYGRKQLTEKHGSLWGNYRIRRLMSGQRSVIAWARLVAALAGYMMRVLTGNRLLNETPGDRASTRRELDERRTA